MTPHGNADSQRFPTPWEAASDAIIDARDAYPRLPDDAPSDCVADAVIAALVDWHERRADMAETSTTRTLHLWAADQLRLTSGGSPANTGS